MFCLCWFFHGELWWPLSWWKWINDYHPFWLHFLWNLNSWKQRVSGMEFISFSYQDIRNLCFGLCLLYCAFPGRNCKFHLLPGWSCLTVTRTVSKCSTWQRAILSACTHNSCLFLRTDFWVLLIVLCFPGRNNY